MFRQRRRRPVGKLHVAALVTTAIVVAVAAIAVGFVRLVNASDTFVTSYGVGSGYCNILGWSGGALNVGSYSQGGAPADAQFDATLQTAE